MDRLNKLKIKKLLAEYDYLLSDSEYKSEIIDSERPDFLEKVSKRVTDLDLKPNESSVDVDKKSKNKKIEDSKISKTAKSSIKKMFREIVKLTHPDKTVNSNMVDLYVSAKEAYDNNDYLQICFIANKLNIEIIIDDSDINFITDLIELKKTEIESIEKSWMWVWLNAKTDLDRDQIINSYCMTNFSNNNNNMEEIESKLNRMYSISPYNKEYINATHFKTRQYSTYGEITKGATDYIVELFKDHFNQNTVFYDLGSGLGKMVSHIGLKYNPKKSIGVELSKERLKATSFIKSEFNLPNNVEFIEGSFLNIDLKDATVIYCDNTMYDDTMMLELFDRIPKGCLCIFRRKIIKLDGLKQKTDLNLKTTYNKNTIYYIVK